MPAGLVAIYIGLFSIWLLPVGIAFPAFGAVAGTILGAFVILIAVRRVNRSDDRRGVRRDAPNPDDP